MLATYPMTVDYKLSRALQTLYNLNWKHVSGRPNGKTYTNGVDTIDFFPTAIDYTVDGKTYQVKWEIADHKVINITFPHPELLDRLDTFLTKYLWGKDDN